MYSIGFLAFQFIPIILGTLILAYSDWKLLGIVSIVFGLCCIVYALCQPCIGCYGGSKDPQVAYDNPDYKVAVRNAKYTTMIIFVMSIGFSLLIWNFVGRRSV